MHLNVTGNRLLQGSLSLLLANKKEMLAKTSSVPFTLQQGGSILLLVTLSPHQTRIYVYESILQLCHVSLKLDFRSMRH